MEGWGTGKFPRSAKTRLRFPLGLPIQKTPINLVFFDARRRCRRALWSAGLSRSSRPPLGVYGVGSLVEETEVVPQPDELADELTFEAVFGLEDDLHLRRFSALAEELLLVDRFDQLVDREGPNHPGAHATTSTSTDRGDRPLVGRQIIRDLDRQLRERIERGGKAVVGQQVHDRDHEVDAALAIVIDRDHAHPFGVAEVTQVLLGADAQEIEDER